MRKNIFGLDIEFRFDDPELANVVKEELDLYPPATGSDSGIVISDNETESEVISRNPSTHLHIRDGFAMLYGQYSIRWIFSGSKITRIEISHLRSGKYSLKRMFEKFKSRQFLDKTEEFGQVLHEAVLVPLAFMQKGNFPLHGSGLSSPSGKGIVLGGTGGVGKTSASLRLGQLSGWKFVADDFSIISEDGALHPNLAQPKIYAYNLMGQNALGQRVLGGRGLLDRLHWSFWKRTRGPSFVRRRVPADHLFNVAASPVKLGAYVILSRKNCKTVELKVLKPEVAISATISVLLTEYEMFFRHFHWAQFNDLMTSRDSFPFHVDNLVDEWVRSMSTVLHNLPCYELSILLEIPHSEYLDSIHEKLEVISN